MNLGLHKLRIKQEDIRIIRALSITNIDAFSI